MTDREKLIELLSYAISEYDQYEEGHYENGEPMYESFEEIVADNLLRNGVIVPPCKVGDIVWIVEPTECNGYGCPYNGDFGNWRCNVNGKEQCKPFVYEMPFNYGMIGSKFYLTCKEAEKALAERSKQDDS